jgi:hypothetical protein
MKNLFIYLFISIISVLILSCGDNPTGPSGSNGNPTSQDSLIFFVDSISSLNYQWEYTYRWVNGYLHIPDTITNRTIKNVKIEFDLSLIGTGFDTSHYAIGASIAIKDSTTYQDLFYQQFTNKECTGHFSYINNCSSFVKLVECHVERFNIQYYIKMYNIKFYKIN